MHDLKPDRRDWIAEPLRSSYPHFLAILFVKISQQNTGNALEEGIIRPFLITLCRNTEGQDVAEYAIMLAVVLVIVLGMVRMIGANASTVFSQVGSAIQ